jgi:hypothetical protein
MVTMTIHADEPFAEALRAYADGVGKSINQTVKDILTPILGLSKKDNATPWSKFYGAMPEIDSSAWTREISEMRKIDEEMWK